MIKLEFKKPTGIKFTEPSMVSAKVDTEDTDSTYLEIFGEARRYIYGNLKLSQSLSNQVYKISDKAWVEIISALMVDENDEPTLELNKDGLKYGIAGENNLVTITEAAAVETNWNKFKDDIINNFANKDKIHTNDIFVEDELLQKFIITKEIENKPYSALNIIELDFKSSYFKIYSGIKYNENGVIVLQEKPSLMKQKIGEFLEALDLEAEINLAEKMSLLIAQDFENSERLTSKISVRELLDILKIAKMKIEYETDKNTEGKVLQIVGIEEEDSNKICDTINSFKIPFKSLSRMSYLKKSFKQDNLNFMEVLEMLSKYIYSTVLNVNGRLLTIVAQALLSKDYDQAVIKSELESNNID